MYFTNRNVDKSIEINLSFVGDCPIDDKSAFLHSMAWRLIVEQIIAYVRRIVQIMIQATDLAQILYRGHPSRKKRGPRKISIWLPFSKMAAMGYPDILLFSLKGQQMIAKDNHDNQFYV